MDTPRKARKIRVEKPKLTPKEKLINTIMLKAGRDTAPSAKEVFEGRSGARMNIKNIGIFIDKPEDELLAEVAEACQVKNTINLSTKVDINRVKQIGIQIMEAGRVWSTIEVAKLTDGTKSYECWSGRHRLAFLALMYGADTEVPVAIREMSTNDARDAVIYANQSRRIEGLEKAEHTVLKAVGGNVNASRKEMYESAVNSKTSVPAFCVYSVMEGKTKGIKLGFPISLKSSRKSSGGLTTINNLRGFWKAAIEWSGAKTLEEFDEDLRLSVEYLNKLVLELQATEGFNPKQHLAAMPLVAAGHMFSRLIVASSAEPSEFVGPIAEKLVSMGDIGREKSDIIRDKLIQHIKQVLKG